MKTSSRRLRLLIVMLAAVGLSVAGCGSGSSSGPSKSSTGGGTLVVDVAFQLKTLDPGRQFERTGTLITKALYDTLLTFVGGDVTKVVPDLASYTLSDDAKTVTLTLAPDRKFSDGAPVTADDVVFSLQRVAGMKGNPSFLLDGVTITKKDDKTVVLTSGSANAQLPYILASPSLGIVNSKVVKANGGTTDDKDAAEKYLNTISAGAGPYTLKTMNVSSEVRLTKNPKYNGNKKPTYDTIVFRNVDSPTQKINVQRGDSQVALDLTGDQTSGLNSDMTVTNGPSAYVIFLLLNQSKNISTATSNPDYVSAVKKAIDFQAVLAVTGKGSAQPAGVIPSLFTGALPDDKKLTFDLEGAKSALAASGMAGQTVELSYPNDNSVFGLSMQTIAERLQSQFTAAGIKVTLTPAPVATELDKYRGGKEEMGLWSWGPDYPEAADYLVFGPGGLVGKRANWQADASPEIAAAAKAAAAEGNPDKRITLFHDFQEKLNTSGPFIPLLQPAVNIVTAGSVTGAVYSPIWTVDIAALGAK